MVRYNSNSESSNYNVLLNIEPGLDSNDDDKNSDWDPNKESNSIGELDDDANTNNDIIVEDDTNNDNAIFVHPLKGKRQQKK